jgi:putative transcriptional regulator
MPVLVKLKNTREAKGFSQNELARRTGYSLQNIQKIEQGRAASITFDALGRFCKILQCQPGDILEWLPDDIDEKIRLSDANKEIGLSTLEEIEVKDDPPKRKKNKAHMIIIDANIDVA